MINNCWLWCRSIPGGTTGPSPSSSGSHLADEGGARATVGKIGGHVGS